jgi:large subunit ribosomal protein L3
MGRKNFPRSGSMQFWPRKRAKRVYPRVKSWAKVKDAKLLGFAGYKVGMTHVMYTDAKGNSLTKGEDIFCPATIVECPPMKILGIRFYKKDSYGENVVADVISSKVEKELSRKIPVSKKQTKKIEDIKDFDDIKLIVYTQPKLTSVGKKKPEIFEIAIGGSKDDKLNFAKEKINQEIRLGDVFHDGQQVDIHAVTKGKGFQGPVKRFGIKIRQHKSEKTKRGPGSLGGWKAQGQTMYRVPHAGQTGFQVRTEYNKWVMKIGTNPEEINPKSGFKRYGLIKNNYVLIKGSVAGPTKRLLRFNEAIRPATGLQKDPPNIQKISIMG